MNIFAAKKIHFIGIGGIGTSSIAHILIKKGKKISGSDQTPSEITKSLKLAGATVYIGHCVGNIKNPDLVVYSPAIPNSNPEMKVAKESAIPTISYPEALGQLTKEYYTIAVAGTHGKSTTTAIASLIAIRAKLDPTIVIGTKMPELNDRNYRVGKSKLLLIEACEYKRSFLKTFPNILVITNIEPEHLDYFKTKSNYKKAFKELIKRVPRDGIIISNKSDKVVQKIIGKDPRNIAVELQEVSRQINLKPGVPGEFNKTNSMLAAKALDQLGIKHTTIEKAISSFKGTWRRMQRKKLDGFSCQFIDDYAHHPTEIELTLNAVREKHPHDRILCIFQPHQYSRTFLLLKQFARSFTNVDKVVIPNIYRVRDTEEDIAKVTPQMLVEAINKFSKSEKACFGDGLEKTADYVKDNAGSYDLIITMGAGDISSIYRELQT